MPRNLYRCLLRLHPPAFRARFSDEMLSIYDCTERPLSAFGLLCDAIASLVRQWTLRADFWHELPPAPSQPAADGVPSFHIIAPFRPRSSAVIHGLVLSAALFCVTCFAIKYSWIHVLHVHISELEREGPAPAQPSVSRNDFRGLAPEPPRNDFAAFTASDPSSPSRNLLEHERNTAVATPTPERSFTPNAGSPKESQPLPGSTAKNAASLVPAPAPRSSHDTQKQAAAGRVESPPKRIDSALDPAKGSPRPSTPTAENTEPQAATHGISLDAPSRHRVIAGAIANLNQYYVYPEVADKMSHVLLANEASGEDNATTDGPSLADLLTRQMRDISHDKHLAVIYSQVRTPDESGPTPGDLVRYRSDMLANNCTFEKIEVLPHNIGYLKLNSFPNPSICQSTAASAMDRLSKTDAIIFDLRTNHGGDPKMVAFIASYLFARPTHLNDLYNRARNTTQESWTISPIPGNELADKPAFVLTSPSTFSGAEEFAYDLKMLKRATIVGETTAGGSHMASRYRIDDHFMMMLPDTRPINPISKTDWEGSGVEPDVKVNASDALVMAEKLAETKLHKK
ncbi:MAG TPA: S41 family peptidase [Candidatus Sulfotelmatobacter sp.]|jgi:hypothetical protein|nr:S41 family peptidase [Candidatus Sulfotelmatobacter sp.]